MLDATCTKCRESFTPDPHEDVVGVALLVRHYVRDDGATECGGVGTVEGAYGPNAESVGEQTRAVDVLTVRRAIDDAVASGAIDHALSLELFALLDVDDDDEDEALHRVTAAQLRDAVHLVLPGVHVACHQTGGGTATVYVGDDKEPQLLIGPGTYDWSNPDASTFWIGDDATCIGPDDDGEAEPDYPNSLAELDASLRKWLAVAS